MISVKHLLRRTLALWFCAVVAAGADATQIGLDTSLTAPEAAKLLQSVHVQEGLRGAPLRIRKLALLFGLDENGRWGPINQQEFDATVGALRELRARGHRLIGLIDIDFYPWILPKRGATAHRLSLDLREKHGLARYMREHLDEFVDVWEVGNEPEIFLRDNAEDYVAALKAFWAGYMGASDAPPRASVIMAPLAHAPGSYLQSVLANDLLRHTAAFNFHLYGFAEDVGAFLDQQLRAVAALARSDAPGRRRWGRNDLPIYLTEVGYGGMFREESSTPAARNRQARWFSVVKQDLLRRRPEVVMAFVLKPYVSPIGREMGLVMPNGDGGFVATPALTTWLEPHSQNGSPRPLRLRRFHAPSKIVPNFLPGAGLTALADKTGYVVAPNGGDGQFVLYNFDSQAREVEVRWPAELIPLIDTERVMSLEPGERRVVPVRTSAPKTNRRATVEVREQENKSATAHWSTNLRPARVSGEHVIAEFQFAAVAAEPARAKLAKRPLMTEEQTQVVQGRFLVTDDVEVREEGDSWRITLLPSADGALHRRYSVELALPQTIVPHEDTRFRLEVETEAEKQSEVEVRWRTKDGALFGAPYFVSDSIRRHFERDMLDFSQVFFSRAAKEWRVGEQRFASLLISFRPLTPLPVTIVVHRPQILRTVLR